MILGYEGLPFRILIHGVNKIETHWHSHIEILLVLEDSVEVRVRQERHILKKDDLFIVNSKEIHSIRKMEGKNLLLLFQVDINHYTTYYPEIRNIIFENNYFNESKNKEDADVFKKHIANIVWELNKESPGYKFTMGSEVNLILSYIIKNISKVKFKKDTNINAHKQFSKIKEILDYIEKNLQKRITLDDISQEFYFSASYLSRFFKDMMGMTFQEYLDYVRLDRSSELLLSTDKLVIDVALESGLSSVKTLNRLFRKYYDSTPSEFRDTRNKIFKKIQQRMEKSDKITNSYFDVDMEKAHESLYKYLDMKKENNKKIIGKPNMESNNIYIHTAIDKNLDCFRQYWKELTTFGRVALGLRSDVEIQVRELENDIYMDLGKENIQNNLYNSYQKINTYIEASPDIYTTDWNASSKQWNSIHDSCLMANYIIYNVIKRMNKTESLGHWIFTDIIKEIKSHKKEFYGGFGLITSSGFKKPSYFAYSMLDKLGDIVIDQGRDYIVTKKNKDIQILIYNYTYFDKMFLSGDTFALQYTQRYMLFEEELNKVNINIVDISGTYKVTKYKLDRDNGSVYDNWIKIGSPEDMDKEEIEYLKGISQPKRTVEYVELDCGYKDEIYTSVYGVDLITLEKK